MNEPYQANVITMTLRVSRKQTHYLHCHLDNGESLSVFDGNINKLSAYPLPQTVGETVYWTTYPVPVTVRRDGNGYNVLLSVTPPSPVAVPDALPQDTSHWRRVAVTWARRLLESYAVLLDVESTGLHPLSEIIQLGMIGLPVYAPRPAAKPAWHLRYKATVAVDRYWWRHGGKGGVAGLNFHFNPAGENTAEAVNGLSAEFLAQQPRWESQHSHLHGLLDNRVWVAYNIHYDLHMLMAQQGKGIAPLIVPSAIVDLLPIVSWYMGEFDAYPTLWRKWKLAEAAEAMGLPVDETQVHGALYDCRLMLGVLLHMANENIQ